MENISERLLAYLSFKGISRNKFYVETGFSNGYLDKRPNIGADKIERIIYVYQDINIEWLLTGNGDMLKKVYQNNDIIEEVNDNSIQYAPNKTKLKTVSKGMVPYYDIDFAAGNDIMFTDDASINPSYYMDIPEFSGCTAFRVYSDSMEKLIKSGTIVFGTIVKDWSVLEYGQIYGITIKDGRRFIKYVKRAENHKEEFTLKSENSFYDDFDIPKQAIRSIWLIHGWLNKRV